MSLAVKRYARALLESATEENLLPETYADFKALFEALKGDKSYEKILLGDITALSEKKEIAEKILVNSSRIFRNFVFVLIEKKRYDEFYDIFYSFEEMYKEKMGILECEMVSAIDLSESQKNALKDILSKKYGKKVFITYTTDKSIIGGAKLFLKGKVIDGSVKSALEDLRQILKQ